MTTSEPTADAPTWWVYVLISHDARRTYVGITTDVERRLDQHNGHLPGGAKATRAHGPWSLGTTYGPYDTRGEATRIERAVKKLSGKRRLAFVVGDSES